MSSNTSKRKVNHMEDRLSDLPDEILIKIISCLKTKEAVRTGILSTRWKSVWASVPTPDLCEPDFCFKGEDDNDAQKVADRFSNFVDRVLVARKLPCLEKISIHGRKCDSYLTKSWMHAALERNVSELHVDFYQFYDGPTCELTHDLFSYNKLVVLKLCVDLTLYFPTASSCFPNLKVLQLEGILYKDEDSLPNLLCSCPILEDLVIIRSRWDNLRTLNIISRSLKRLKVISYFEEQVLKMVIDAPAVESLNMSCITRSEYIVKDLSSLVEAELDMSDAENGYKFLRGISNVNFLKLDPCFVETLMLTNFYNLPVFYNLTRLEIYDDGCCELSSLKLLQWKLMLEILKCSPMLEILIYQDYSILPKECGKASDWDVPDCLVSHLKTVEIDYVYDSDGDVEKVKYFLINAQVLEKMTIKSCHSKKIVNDIFDIISKNPKSSVTWSKVMFSISFI